MTHSETGPNGTFSGTRWIMVHGYTVSLGKPNGSLYIPPENETQPGHYLYTSYRTNHRGVHMRSANIIEDWPDEGGTVGNPIVGSSVMRDYLYWGWGGGDIDKKVMTGFNAYRGIHSLKAHGELSQPGGMLISVLCLGKVFLRPGGV